ncbi:MAG: protein kinase [Sandaracinaceae bacterium]|nr:protein kinase [Sandaracinaceae bacterium]
MAADRTELPAVGRVVGEKYRLDAKLGAGGMGAVYAATHVVTGKRVALKWMLPALSEDAVAATRFVREARIAGQVEHPNIVNIFDVGRDADGSLYLVMELLRGRPLSREIGPQGMAIAELVDAMLLVMRGIHHAHQVGAVHRDLKPDNLFITEGGDAKVVDFGIGYLRKEETGLALTRTGVALGTPLYMSPEQITNSKEVDLRSDIYSLGVVLYEGLTGTVPFQADNYAALAVRIATHTPLAPRALRPDVPPALEQIVLRALARRPEDRFSSVEELARALEPFGSGVRFEAPSPLRRATPLESRHEPELALAATHVSAGPSSRRRPRWPLGVALGALLLGGVALALGAATRGAEVGPGPVIAASPAPPLLAARPPSLGAGAATALAPPQDEEPPRATPPPGVDAPAEPAPAPRSGRARPRPPAASSPETARDPAPTGVPQARPRVPHLPRIDEDEF